jgi:hypothetical protein
MTITGRQSKAKGITPVVVQTFKIDSGCITDFDFHTYKTIVNVNTLDRMYRFNVYTNQFETFNLTGTTITRKHLQFHLNGGKVNIVKFGNLIEICDGNLMDYSDVLVVYGKQQLKIIDLDTMETVSVPTASTRALKFNNQGSLFYQLLQNNQLIVHETNSLRKLRIKDINCCHFISENELLVAKSDCIFLIIINGLDFNSLCLIDFEGQGRARIESISCFADFVCVVRGEVVHVYRYRSRPLPMLEPMYLILTLEMKFVGLVYQR